MLLLGVMELVIIIPGVVGHFFTGATAVFGNATGGRRGAMVGSFVNGIMILFLPVALLLFIGNLGIANSTFSDADFSITGIILGNIAQFVKGGGLFAVCVVLFLLPIIYNVIMPKKKEA